MNVTSHKPSLAEVLVIDNQKLISGFSQKYTLIVKQAALVAIGILALAVCAKIKIPLGFTPVPINLGTFALLSIGVAYGPRLGITTLFGYLLIGLLGFDVFANSSSTSFGWAYMTGSTGGYLAGYVLAVAFLGWATRQGLDRKVFKLALVLFIANALIYVPGVLWLGVIHGWDKPLLMWGLTPFILGDVAKLIAAAAIIPWAWKTIGKARK